MTAAVDTLQDEWVEIFPYGVTIGADEQRPVLIFKDETQRYILPVWISYQDAQFCAGMSHRKINSPADISIKVLKGADIHLEKCLFTDLKGQHQVVELIFAGESKIKNMILQADDVMSFCLTAQAQFFCTKEHMKRSQKIDAEIQENVSIGRINPKGKIIIPDRYLN
ncbi:hypothetical protein N9W41_01180 [bacterium]|nr:hypothetical protein [bacterium]